MNDMTMCGNHETLVTYLYDECKPAERDAIAAHLAVCAPCREELGALRDTRAHLASWTPPALPLGFQITRIGNETPAKVLRPAAFWRQPLPAWAQVAAAAVIFVAGMSVNALRPAPAPSSIASAPDGTAVTVPVSAPGVSREQLAELDARLRAIEDLQTRAVASRLPAAPDAVRAARTGAGIDEGELFAQVSGLVEERMARNQEQNVALIRYAAANVMSQAKEEIKVVKEDQQQQRHAIEAMIQSPFVKVALQASAQ